MTTRAPSLGRGCRAQRGGVSFLFAAKPPPLCLPPWGRRCVEKSGILVSLPSPLGKGYRATVDRVLSLTAYLRRSLPALFHTAFPIQPPPLRGTSFHRKEGMTTRAPSFGRGCRAQRGGVGFLFAAKPLPLCLPHAGKAVLSLCHHPQPALPLRGQAKEAQGASCASLIGMHFPAEIRCIYFLMSFRIAAEGKTALPEVFLFADIAFDRPAIEESTDIEE